MLDIDPELGNEKERFRNAQIFFVPLLLSTSDCNNSFQN